MTVEQRAELTVKLTVEQTVELTVEQSSDLEGVLGDSREAVVHGASGARVEDDLSDLIRLTQLRRPVRLHYTHQSWDTHTHTHVMSLTFTLTCTSGHVVPTQASKLSMMV